VRLARARLLGDEADGGVLRAVPADGDLVGEFPAQDGELYRPAISSSPGLRDLRVVNGEAWRRAEIPAVNGHGTAGAVARFYAGLVGGGTSMRKVRRDDVSSAMEGRVGNAGALGDQPPPGRRDLVREAASGVPDRHYPT
jgi:hypothetical protein